MTMAIKNEASWSGSRSMKPTSIPIPCGQRRLMKDRGGRAGWHGSTFNPSKGAAADKGLAAIGDAPRAYVLQP
jgi:hypothetical protein